MITDYHAKYHAYELNKRCRSDSLEKVAGAISHTQVDLNPHSGSRRSLCLTFAIVGGGVVGDMKDHLS
jgi:hypothetical protein